MTSSRAVLAALLLAGCGAPDPPASTGGVSLPVGRCGRGLMVVASDYQSTNVSLLATDGEMLSSSFLSSASASAALSAPLSGDVVAPTSALLGGEVVLVDRYPAAVVSFVTLASATVRAQLNVSTGFSSNPQDYLAISDERAYVSRYDANPEPGRQPFDGGSDVLVLDPNVPAIVERLDLSSAMEDAPGFLPRPSRLVRDGERVHVLLAAYDGRFTDSAPSRLVTIANDAVLGTTVLSGLHGCNAIAMRGQLLAVGCSGKFDGATSTVAEAGVVLLSTDSELPHEVGRFAASELVGQPLGFSVDFVDDTRLLVTAFGSLEPLVSDVAFELDTASGTVRRLVEAGPFELGEARCVSPVEASENDEPRGCGLCYVADAGRGQLQRLSLTPEGLTVLDVVAVDVGVGLPPRYLGRF